MEQNIKNFDRKVEQMMNEQQTAPPFGMWNRISAELDATMPAAAPANSFIPKRAFVGFIAGIAIIGASVVAGYLLNSSVNNWKNNNVVANPVIKAEPAINNSPVVNANLPVIEPKSIMAPVAINQTKKAEKVNNTQVSDIVKTDRISATASEPLPPTVEKAERTIGQVVAASEPAADAALSTEVAFYFPPVDMNISEKANAAKMAAAKPVDDDKAEVVPIKEQKLKFHPPHRKQWHYGKWNKVK